MTDRVDSPRTTVSTVRVRYAETDQMQVAYHGHYFAWFEVARTDWLRDAGVTYKSLEADGYFLPVIEAHCEYRTSARYDDDLIVTATARLASPVRMAFDYAITVGSTLVATGTTVHATVDRDGRPIRVPARLKELFR